MLKSLVGAMGICCRIVGDEMMISEELEGYAEYKMQGKYRMISLIW